MNRELRHQVSLVSNFALAAIVGALVFHKLNRASALSAIEGSPGEVTIGVNPRKMANQKPFSNQPPKLTGYVELASASDRRRWIVDQLRAMGVPNDTLALVARVDFEAQWDSRSNSCLTSITVS